MFKRFSTFFIIVIFSMLFVGCGNSDSATPETSQDTETADTIDQTEGEETEGAASSPALEKLSFPEPNESPFNQFETSYRYVFTPEGADDPTLVTDVQTAIQQEPSAIKVHNTFDSSGFAEADTPSVSGVNTTLVVDGVTYSIIEPDDGAPSCFASAENTEIMEETFRNNSFTNQLNAFDDSITSDFELIGTEDINGIEASHYRAEGIPYGTYADATLDIWQQVDGGLVVKMEIVGQTTDPSTGPGTQEIYYEVLSVDQPLDFDVPTFCN